jgi:hypothetical protein
LTEEWIQIHLSGSLTIVHHVNILKHYENEWEYASKYREELQELNTDPWIHIRIIDVHVGEKLQWCPHCIKLKGEKKKAMREETR